MAFEYKEEYAWLTNICLNVTDACNLACRYCFVEQHPHFMTYEVAQKAVYFILDNLEKKNKKFNKNDKASITFFGGEPTLMWDEIIVPLTTWIRENNFPITLGMTTNGTLLNEERIEFLKDNNFNLLLSIDGNENTQNYNRPCRDENLKSFDLVNINIPLILKNFPNITFRSTIYAPTVHETFNNYMFAISKGFSNIFMMPDIRHEWTDEQIEILMQEIDKIFMFINKSFDENIVPINFSPVDKAMKYLVQFTQDSQPLEINRQCNRCGLGTSMGSVGYDGSIYGCQEQPSKSDTNIFYLGDIYTGINKDLHLKLLSEYNKKAKAICNDLNQCNKCSLRKICQNWACPSSSWDLFKNFHMDSYITCLWREKIFANTFILYSNLHNNSTFKNYFEEVLK